MAKLKKNPRHKKEDWDKMKPWMVDIFGQWLSWIVPLAAGAIYIITGIVQLVSPLSIIGWGLGVGWLTTGTAIWQIIGGGITLVVVFIYAMPIFSKKMVAEDYEFLLEDIIKLGKLRIPKMLFWAIIIGVTTYWGASIIGLLFLLILILGPYEFDWGVGKESSGEKKETKKEPKKEKAKPKPKPKEEPKKEVKKEPEPEPEPEPEGGESYTMKGDIYVCSKCGKEYKTERGITNHVPSCEG